MKLPFSQANRKGLMLPGGGQVQRFSILPWEFYCGTNVFKDGGMQTCIFNPQPSVTLDEAFQTLAFLVAANTPKSGPVAWDTVPEGVQRHFRFKE